MSNSGSRPTGLSTQGWTLLYAFPISTWDYSHHFDQLGSNALSTVRRQQHALTFVTVTTDEVDGSWLACLEPRHTTCAFCTPAYVVFAVGRCAPRCCIAVARRSWNLAIHPSILTQDSSPTCILIIYHVFFYSTRQPNYLIVAQPHGSLRAAMTFLASIQQYGGFRGGED